MPTFRSDDGLGSSWEDYPISQNDPASVIEDAERQRHRLMGASSRLFDSCIVRLEILRIQAGCKIRFRSLLTIATMTGRINES